MSHSWNASLYESQCSFVWEYGKDVLALLDPKPGERILDVGCGTGHLTAEIARAGAVVTGIDSSAEMVAQARDRYPEVLLEVRDVCDLPYREEFDAVFSNAALHWITRADEAAAAMARALKAGGRFVAELGGHGNIRALMDASDRALRALGVPGPQPFHPWYFPSVGEYASILERYGLEVTLATLFDRPTAIDGGDDAIPAWLRMFGSRLAGLVPPEKTQEYQRLTREFAAPALRRDDSWFVDYRRLRIVARKPVRTSSRDSS